MTLTVYQTFLSKVLFKVVMLLGGLNLISLERTIKIINLSLRNGAFKYRVDKGKWKHLKGVQIDLSEVD